MISILYDAPKFSTGKDGTVHMSATPLFLGDVHSLLLYAVVHEIIPWEVLVEDPKIDQRIMYVPWDLYDAHRAEVTVKCNEALDVVFDHLKNKG